MTKLYMYLIYDNKCFKNNYENMNFFHNFVNIFPYIFIETRYNISAPSRCVSINNEGKCKFKLVFQLYTFFFRYANTDRWIGTFVLFNCRFPLYQVMMAVGREPVDSQDTSYLLSATKGLSFFKMTAVMGFTGKGNGE